MDSSCSALMDGDWLTAAWLLAAIVSGIRLGSRTAADVIAGWSIRWFNWAALAAVSCLAQVGFVSILDAPDDRCDAPANFFFALFPLAVVSVATSLALLLRASRR
jgi:hypothetical protein